MEHCDLIRGHYDVTTEHCDIIMKHCCVTQSTVISQWSTVMTQRNTVIAKHRTVMSPYSTVLLKTQRFDGAVEHCDATIMMIALPTAVSIFALDISDSLAILLKFRVKCNLLGESSLVCIA